MSCTKAFVVVFLVILCTNVITGGVFKRKPEVKLEPCSPQTPCGWAVYNSTNRKIIYYMQNTCKCENNLKCLRDIDDVSISSYTYYCKSGPTIENTS